MAELDDAPAIKSVRFRKEREGQWRQLDDLVSDLDRRGRDALSPDECLSLPRLYRQALSGLSVARSISLDANVAAYLEGLVLRAYFHVYGSRARLWSIVRDFFVKDWPGAVRAIWRPIALSAAMLLAGALTGYHLSASDPGWYFTFVGQDMAQGRDPSATTQYLRDTIYRPADEEADPVSALSAFAAYLFQHNSRIALLCFALGVMFGVPTLLLLFSTGGMLGAFIALFASRGLGWDLGGWLMIHGVTELGAIILAGGAGLHLGAAAAFPGRQTRRARLAAAGRQASVVAAGCVLMLFAAGILEGLGRQLIQDMGARYLVAGATLAFWCAYFLTAGRETRDAPGG